MIRTPFLHDWGRYSQLSPQVIGRVLASNGQEHLPDDLARIMLATLETAIGVGLITGKSMRFTLLMLVGQMLGTVTPLVLFLDVTWSGLFVPTLEGQYILKNVVLVSAALAIGATVRGGGLTDDPEILEAVGHR